VSRLGLRAHVLKGGADLRGEGSGPVCLESLGY